MSNTYSDPLSAGIPVLGGYPDEAAAARAAQNNQPDITTARGLGPETLAAARNVLSPYAATMAATAANATAAAVQAAAAREATQVSQQLPFTNPDLVTTMTMEEKAGEFQPALAWPPEQHEAYLSNAAVCGVCGESYPGLTMHGIFWDEASSGWLTFDAAHAAEWTIPSTEPPRTTTTDHQEDFMSQLDQTTTDAAPPVLHQPRMVRRHGDGSECGHAGACKTVTSRYAECICGAEPVQVAGEQPSRFWRSRHLNPEQRQELRARAEWILRDRSDPASAAIPWDTLRWGLRNLAIMRYWAEVGANTAFVQLPAPSATAARAAAGIAQGRLMGAVSVIALIAGLPDDVEYALLWAFGIADGATDLPYLEAAADSLEEVIASEAQQAQAAEEAAEAARAAAEAGEAAGAGDAELGGAAASTDRTTGADVPMP